MYKDSLNALLQTVITDLKLYEDAKRKSGAFFNVFEVTGINRKEVAMCAFLSELLNPNGHHGMGSLFLKSFCIDVLALDGFADDDYKKAKVETEVVIDSDRRIDILLRFGNRLFPIEVKIHAEDQDTQCLDYYHYAIQYDPKSILFYLTLDGHKPSEKSKQALNEDQYRCISFAFDVLDWVAGLTEKAEIKQSANMLSVLSQFEDALEHLTSRQERDVTAMMKKILVNRESFHAAKMIEQSLPAIKSDMMIKFFSAIQEVLKAYVGEFPLVHADYSFKATEYYSKKTSTWPSINYLLPNISTDPEKQYVLRIEVDWNLYCGVCNWDEKTKTNPNGTTSKEIIEFLRSLSLPGTYSEKGSDAFYWWEYLTGTHGNIDFRGCNESYEDLFDESLFQETVEKICKEIANFFDLIRENG